MTGYEFGDVVLIPFPFTDQTAAKKRPAVVVSSTAYHRSRPDLILMAVTSRIKPYSGFGDVTIEHWKPQGLSNPPSSNPSSPPWKRALSSGRWEPSIWKIRKTSKGPSKRFWDDAGVAGGLLTSSMSPNIS